MYVCDFSVYIELRLGDSATLDKKICDVSLGSGNFRFQKIKPKEEESSNRKEYCLTILGASEIAVHIERVSIVVEISE